MPYKNIEDQKENRKKWYLTHKESVIRRSAKWRINNKDKRKIICKKWRDNNPEYSKLYSKNYKKINKEKIAEYSKKYWQMNKGKRDKNYYKEYYKKNSERLVRQQRERREKDPERYRQIGLKSRRKNGFKKRLKAYNISKETYDNFLIKQNNACAICKLEKNLYIDHCHITKIVRGLLCRECNSAIGLLKDNKSNLKNAYDYLTTPPKSSKTS